MTRLSFGSVRAVKLRSTSLVLLADRCHRVLGVRSLWLGDAGWSVGFLHPGFRALPQYRFALVYLCAIIVGKASRSSKLLVVHLR